MHKSFWLKTFQEIDDAKKEAYYLSYYNINVFKTFKLIIITWPVFSAFYHSFDERKENLH